MRICVYAYFLKKSQPKGASVASPTPLVAPPPGPIPLLVDRFTLPVLKNATDYLAARDLILYWLCCPGFSTARSDSALITDSMNALASQFWEGQIRTASQASSGIFLSFPIHRLQFLRFSRSCSSCAPFIRAMRVSSSISLHPRSRRIFLRPLSIRFSRT